MALQSRPNGPLIAGQLSRPQATAFDSSPPQQYGIPQAIPNNTHGDTSQRVFHKINAALAPGPIARIVVKIQQARF